MAGSRQAFALVEVAAAAAVMAVVVALLVVAGPGNRHAAWQAGSIANLHEFAAATGSYGADYTDRVWSYSWRYGEETLSQYPDLRNPPLNSVGPSQYQGTDILRRLTGRADLPVIDDWVPCSEFAHLVLADYLGGTALLRFAVSPGDRNKRLWSNDVEGFDAGAYAPVSPDPRADARQKRWPYSSSYRVPIAFFVPDARTAGTGTVFTINDWYQEYAPLPNFGERRASEVAFPSQKVFVHDSAQWQGVRRPVWYRYSFARVPVLLFDGSAHVRATGLANQGFQPNVPRNFLPSMYYYTPRSWDPAVIGNPPILPGYYSYTRGGIRGHDFDGPETDTSTW